MPPKPAQTGLPYEPEPAKSTWSKKYVRGAFDPADQENVSRLFKRASELVVTHDLTKWLFTANKPLGHESRLIAVAEVCRVYCLPDELVLMVLDMVEPIDMFRVPFTRHW